MNFKILIPKHKLLLKSLLFGGTKIFSCSKFWVLGKGGKSHMSSFLLNKEFIKASIMAIQTKS